MLLVLQVNRAALASRGDFLSCPVIVFITQNHFLNDFLGAHIVNASIPLFG